MMQLTQHRVIKEKQIQSDALLKTNLSRPSLGLQTMIVLTDAHTRAKA